METKICTKCKQDKFLSEFYKDAYKKDRLSCQCKACNGKHGFRYRKTKNGLASLIYGHQKASSKIRNHSNVPYTLSEFREWLFSQKKFPKLYENWIRSNCDKNLSPSCDRIDDYKGYSFENINLMTWAENNKKGVEDMINGINRKTAIPILQYSKDDIFIKEYYSQRQAARELNIDSRSINSALKGRALTCGGFIWKYKNV